MILTQKIIEMIQEHNRLINDICEKYRLYPQLHSYSIMEEIPDKVFTFPPEIWDWIYKTALIAAPQRESSFPDKVFKLTFNIEILKDMYNSREPFTKNFMKYLYLEIEERNRKNG